MNSIRPNICRDLFLCLKQAVIIEIGKASKIAEIRDRRRDCNWFMFWENIAVRDSNR